MKTLVGIIALVVVAVIGYMFWSPSTTNAPTSNEVEKTESSAEEADDNAQSDTADERFAVTDGRYEVKTDASIMHWAGRKPLIDGYVDSGSIALSDGTIRVVENTTTGTFTVDMNTISVSATPVKPGQESALERHLQSDRWFDVDTYPTATFTIREATPQGDSSTSFVYDVRGDLTLKGETHELTFPATIYLDAEGTLHADAHFEIDRTRWGIIAGSDSFFDNLENNVISDMITLSFELVAEAQS